MFKFFLAFAAATLPSVAWAQQAQQAQQDIHIVVGHLGVSNGYKDRTYTTAMYNQWAASGLGIHGEAHYISREENAGYFAGGVGYQSKNFTTKATLGTSTENDGILPRLFARAEVTAKTDPIIGFFVTPSLTYREFRNSVEELTLGGEIGQWFSLGRGQAVVATLSGRSSWIDPGEHVAPAIGLSLLYNQAKRFSFGVGYERGRSSYDAVKGKGTFDEPYWSLRGNAATFVSENVELTLNGEYTDLNAYNVIGGTAGVKINIH